jgi:tetratricopeptide (TPR) repeat protein
VLKRIIISLFGLTFFGSIGFPISPDKDSLVDPLTIRFQSEIEKNALFQYLGDSSSTNFIRIMILTSLTATNEDVTLNMKKVEEFVAEMRTAHVEEMKEKKKIKFIYDKLHAKFFKQYQSLVFFSSIFKDGTYNCVTASALFAYVFDALHIPYVIMESTDHVFLVAYPQSFDIKVETTVPSQGSVSYNSTMQATYVNYLKSNKIISEDESKQKSVSEIFNSYFFHVNIINEKKLAGLHFYNNGIEKIAAGNFTGAFSQFEKAYSLYPSKRLTFFLYVSLAELISKSNYSDSIEIEYIAKASHYKSFGITAQNIQAEFYRLTQNILVNKTDFINYDRAYKYLTAHIDDKEILAEISFTYASEEARIYLNKENYTKAFELATLAYNLRPQNSDVQTFFNAVLDKTFIGLSTSQYILRTQQLDKEFPQLKTNTNYYLKKIHAYLYYFGELYNLKDLKNAEIIREAFEEMEATGPEVTLNSALVSQSYSSAGFYFYKIGNKQKARELFKKGLKYAPDDYMLKYRLKGL